MPSSGSIPKPSERIAGLDGLRAIAATGVLARHLEVPGSAMGWTGVPLFFVLSGFLITRILVRTREQPRYYASFYARRSLRIFPIYYLTIFFLVGLLGSSEWPFFVTYTQNYLYALKGWGVADFRWYASHTWSLAVEEQFYFLWPLAIATLTGSGLLRLVWGVIVVSNIFRVGIVDFTHDTIWGYTPLFSQMDLLAWGALGAILWDEQNEALTRVASFGVPIGIALVAVVWIVKGSEFMGSPFLMLSCTEGKLLFAAFGPLYVGVIFLAMRFEPFTRVLELGAFRYCGRISYGVYLYHWPILICLIGIMGLTFASQSLVIVATFTISTISFYLIEQPLLRLKDRIGRGRPVAAAIATSESL